MANTNYALTFRVSLRTLTINDTLTFTANTSTLSTNCDAIGVQLNDMISDQGLTAKSIHGHVSFAAVAGRTLGGQATYSTTYDTATPTVLQKAVVNAVEPEHRVAFALSPADLASNSTISTALQSVVNDAWYQLGLYKHTAKVDD